jgi:predicted 3-demethylubiquinone-9 3-methyltransferase (glyoxalase superfamily)
MPIKQRITPFLWFDSQAEEAAKFYVSIFPNSKVVSTSHYGDAGPGPKGSVMTVGFELDGLSFTALNGGPQYKFTEALSLVVHCETQAEVDHYWNKLSVGGKEVACGWLRDKYGLSWQIVPDALMEFIQDKDPVKSQRVMAAFLQMKKIDIAQLQAVHAAAA